VALDDRYANKFAPLDSTVMHFSTQPLTGTLQVIPLPCAFYFIFSNVDATQAPTLIKPFDYHHKSTLGLIFLERYDPLHIMM
jgi:hypothetical protein